MNSQTFRAIGQALHGPAWQHALAHDLDVSARLIGYYLKGRTIPADMAQRLAPVIAAKIADLERIARTL